MPKASGPTISPRKRTATPPRVDAKKRDVHDGKAASLLARRSKVAAGRANVLLEGLGDADTELVHRRTRELCDDVERYVRELLYGVYCFFLTAKADAYVEIPATFQCCLAVPVLKEMLHRCHGYVTTAAAYLATVEPQLGLPLLQVREELLEKLNSGALAEWPPVDVLTEEALASVPCFVVPRFDNRFLVLKGESTGRVDVDLEAFVAQRDGVVYNAALQHVAMARLTEIEGEREVNERLRRAQAAAEAHAAEEAKAKSMATSSLLFGADDGDGSSIGSPLTAAPASLVPESSHAHAELAPNFCNRCQTCKMCCVCSIVFKR